MEQNQLSRIKNSKANFRKKSLCYSAFELTFFMKDITLVGNMVAVFVCFHTLTSSQYITESHEKSTQYDHVFSRGPKPYLQNSTFCTNLAHNHF